MEIVITDAEWLELVETPYVELVGDLVLGSNASTASVHADVTELDFN